MKNRVEKNRRNAHTTVPNGTRISLGYLVPLMMGTMSSSIAMFSIAIRYSKFHVCDERK